VTTVESHRRLGRVSEAMETIGVDIDPHRVHAAAAAPALPRLTFAIGGFDFQPPRPAGLVRAMNVLRQYDELDVSGSLGQVAIWMAPGGLLVEGTSDPLGRLVAFSTWQRNERPSPRAPARPHAEALLQRLATVFAVRARPDFEPSALRAVLPKEFIHHAGPGGHWEAFFRTWDLCWASTANEPGFRRRWVTAAERLRATGSADMAALPAVAGRRFAVLRRPPGVSG
jgi:hypothetical protein